jgi:uncharacterized membrane protein YccC
MHNNKEKPRPDPLERALEREDNKQGANHQALTERAFARAAARFAKEKEALQQPAWRKPQVRSPVVIGTEGKYKGESNGPQSLP